jgi:hypothetical protein
MNIYLDIETIPTETPEHLAFLSEQVKAECEAAKAAVRAPGNYKDHAKITEYIEQARAALDADCTNKIATAIEKTSFDAAFGRVCCWSYAVEDDDPVTLGLWVAGEEKRMLEHLWGALSKVHSTSGTRPVLVGHNLIAFDLAFLWRRSVILGAKPPVWLPRNPKPWSESVADTMLMWAGDRGTISMDKLLRAMGLPPKSGSGADVWPMYQARKFLEIADYCADDVRRVRDIYKRLTFQ